MKIRFLILLMVTLLSNPILAQTITPKQFLELFSKANDEKAVELIDSQLESYSSKWKIIGGNNNKTTNYVKWYHPKYGLYDGDFYLLAEKTDRDKIINKVIYSFADKELFTTYLSSIKSITGVKLVSSEKMADGSTRLIYESKGVAFFLGTHPTTINEYTSIGINTTYSISMFYH
ncbi:MAG: hypothetical protein EOO43_10155 [Flavobacterium sp.]|nr:MAG: hypothetical protein EOO43_10155 [Flavobacterium sp.]